MKLGGSNKQEDCSQTPVLATAIWNMIKPLLYVEMSFPHKFYLMYDGEQVNS